MDSKRPPAQANERVQINSAGQALLKLKTPWRDGTTHLVMSALEIMQRLAALVVPAGSDKAAGDVHAQHPEKLAELVATWWTQAGRSRHTLPAPDGVPIGVPIRSRDHALTAATLRRCLSGGVTLPLPARGLISRQPLSSR